MSLINDALKRLKQSHEQPQGAAHPTSDNPPTLPISKATPSVANKTAPGPGWMLPLLVILLIGAAAVFIGLAFSRKPASPVAVTPSVSQPVPVNPLPPPSPAAAAKAVAVTAPAPAPPVPRVQGISYFNGQWQAIVNGATVRVGDRVNGFRVEEISKSEVSFISPDGSRKSLALEQ
ncbi:MAG: hypothetical protein ACRED1_03730 [Limisphaerales bacterium]